MGMNIVYSGLESLIYEDLCKVVAAPLDLIISADTDDETVYEKKGVFQGSKVIPKGNPHLSSVFFSFPHVTFFDEHPTLRSGGTHPCRADRGCFSYSTK